MRLGDDVLAKGKKGVVVKIVSGANGIVEVGVYLKPWSQWDEEWAKGWIPKVHMFSPADIAQEAANRPPDCR